MVPSNKRSFKNKTLFILLTVFLLFQPLQAFATEPILDTDQLEEANKPGIIEKHLSKLLINAGNWLLDLSNAQDVSTLVFQRPEVTTGDDEVLPNKSSANRDKMYFGVFPSGLFDGISAFNSFFTSLLPIPMVILLAGGGLFLLFDIMKSNEVRSKAKDMLFGVVVATLMIRFGHIIWGWIIDINYIIVDGMYTVLKAAGIEVTRFTNTIWNSAQYSDLSASQSIGVAIMILCAIFMTFVLNYQYVMRMIQLAMLMVLFPFVLLSSIIPSRKGALNLWFTTFTANVFMQAGHAVALGLFFYTIAKASDVSFWLVMAMLFGLPAMADVVNRIVGSFTGEGGGGGLKSSASNMSGMAGLMAISKIGNTIAGGKGKVRLNGGEQVSSSKTIDNSSTSSNGGFSSTSSPNLSADGGITQANGPAPMSSTLKDSEIAQNGNTGIGSRSAKRLSNMSNKNRALHNVSSLAKGISQGGHKLATSNGAKSFIRSAAIATAAGTGAIVGTMTSGSPSTGAYMGSQIGRSLGGAGNYTREKLGKGIQHGAELIAGSIDTKLGQVEDPHAYTKERLAYTDNAQLYDKQEMGRMGEELIGGKTGKTIGITVGAVSNFVAGKMGSSEQKQAVARVNERKSLGEQINQSRGFQEHAKQELDTSRLQHNHINSQYGSNSEAGKQWTVQKQTEYSRAVSNYQKFPNSEKYRTQFEEAKTNLNQPHPEIQKSQQVVSQHEANYNQHVYQTRQLEQKQANFYRIQKQAEEMKNLQSEVRSSGRL